MSDLEASATPILVDLMATNREVHTLPEDQRLVVARWAAKTAFVLNRGSNYHQLIKRELAHSLRTDPGLPPRVVVVGQHHDDLALKFFWMQSRTWFVRSPRLESELRELQHVTFKIALQFGRLILLVAYWPHSDWLYVYEKGLHVSLFPIRGPVLWADGAEFPWGDASTALIHFAMLLGVGEHPASN